MFQIGELRSVLDRERLKPYTQPKEAADLLCHPEAVCAVMSELPAQEAPDSTPKFVRSRVEPYRHAGVIAETYFEREISSEMRIPRTPLRLPQSNREPCL